MAVKIYRHPLTRVCFQLVVSASPRNFTNFSRIFHQSPSKSSATMPPKRKVAAPVIQEEGSGDMEPKRGRGAKKTVESVPEATGNGDAKPKRGRKLAGKPVRGKKGANESDPEDDVEVQDEPEPVVVEAKKKGRGKKAAPKAEAEEVVAKRSRRQVKAPVYNEDDEDEDGEVIESKGRGNKKGRGRKPAKKQESDEDGEDEEVVEKPVEKVVKGKGRLNLKKEESDEDVQEEPAKKDESDVEEDGDELEKPVKVKGRGGKKAESDDEEQVEKPKAAKGAPKKAAASGSKAEEGLKNSTVTNYDKIEFACVKENALGKQSNFVVASWNVDGLRAWLKKGGLEYLEHEKPDVFCIQEIKCATAKLPSEITELEDYKKFWHNSEKEGYAGVGLLSLVEPIEVSYGIGEDDQDEDGRCVTAEFEDFYVVCAYVPNAGKKLVTLPKRLEWNKAFKSFIKELDRKKPVILCGDLNVAHTEIDLANPKTNTKNAGFTKEEREGFTEFLGDGYVDTYRKLYPDKTGAYTFWTYLHNSRTKNTGWRLDYFVVSERLMDNVCDNIIRSEVLGSDHCPSALFLNV